MVTHFAHPSGVTAHMPRISKGGAPDTPHSMHTPSIPYIYPIDTHCKVCKVYILYYVVRVVGIQERYKG